jgi:hydroxyacylglutathione hydrolase
MSAEVMLATFTDPMFGENAYVVSVTGYDGVWVVDPSFPPQCEEVCLHVERHGRHVEAILLTHGHADHIAGVDAVKRRWPAAALLIGREDAVMLTDPQANLSAPFGLHVRVDSAPTGWLDAGGVLSLGATHWNTLDTSGHSPGGRSLYCAAADLVITGDALFDGGIGRTDFPGADTEQLLANIRRNLLSLPGETRVYSGHGGVTTIEKERISNPFLTE